MGINPAISAGAIISGAYFGDKLSPLSDTTNLAAAVSGTDLFSHIRYMLYTTVPTYIVTLIAFTILSFNIQTPTSIDISETLHAIDQTFTISGWLFLVPVMVIFCILMKVKPIMALLFGTLLGAIFALIFQPNILAKVAGGNTLDFITAYKGIMNAITSDTAIISPMQSLNSLFEAGGMKSMLNTVWLILCAMFFGGVMESIGALKKVTKSLLVFAKNTFGLVASTVASCIAVNITASEQYLSIVIPAKMFAKEYRKRGLAPENLSRTLEDGGTLSSVLIPWTTCGAYNAGGLGVETLAYLPYAFFNIISPIMTLIFVAFSIKIKRLFNSDQPGELKAQ